MPKESVEYLLRYRSPKLAAFQQKFKRESGPANYFENGNNMSFRHAALRSSSILRQQYYLNAHSTSQARSTRMTSIRRIRLKYGHSHPLSLLVVNDNNIDTLSVGSTSQYPSDTQNIIPQGPMNPGIESTSPSTRLPEIPLLSSFHLSSYDLEAPTCEEDKTRRSNDGAQIDSSNTVSSSKSSSFLPLVANASGKGHVEQSVNPSDRDRSSDDSDPDTKPGNNPAHSKDFGNESEETLDAAEVDALLKQDESSSFSNTSSA
ncbi:hypothetical protein GGU10DRAFT_391468, partial [Lentinula aff. detonsa]